MRRMNEQSLHGEPPVAVARKVREVGRDQALRGDRLVPSGAMLQDVGHHEVCELAPAQLVGAAGHGVLNERAHIRVHAGVLDEAAEDPATELVAHACVGKLPQLPRDEGGMLAGQCRDQLRDHEVGMLILARLADVAVQLYGELGGVVGAEEVQGRLHEAAAQRMEGPMKGGSLQLQQRRGALPSIPGLHAALELLQPLWLRSVDRLRLALHPRPSAALRRSNDCRLPRHLRRALPAQAALQRRSAGLRGAGRDVDRILRLLGRARAAMLPGRLTPRASAAAVLELGPVHRFILLLLPSVLRGHRLPLLLLPLLILLLLPLRILLMKLLLLLLKLLLLQLALALRHGCVCLLRRAARHLFRRPGHRRHVATSPLR
mmetsp:Transcript_86746/g.250572  ORF Transcript_86746/g.250572 Transcript_86746/m.250572 type:complete len:375 (-) Transcript_86746:863-1987(-)